MVFSTIVHCPCGERLGWMTWRERCRRIHHGCAVPRMTRDDYVVDSAVGCVYDGIGSAMRDFYSAPCTEARAIFRLENVYGSSNDAVCTHNFRHLKTCAGASPRRVFDKK